MILTEALNLFWVVGFPFMLMAVGCVFAWAVYLALWRRYK